MMSAHVLPPRKQTQSTEKDKRHGEGAFSSTLGWKWGFRNVPKQQLLFEFWRKDWLRYRCGMERK